MTVPFAARAYTPAGETHSIERPLVREHHMTVIVNGKPYARFVCTRGSLRELVAGRLLGDGRLQRPADLRDISFSEDETRCTVAAGPADMPRTKRRPAPAVWEAAWIFAAAERFADGTAMYRATAAVHLAYLYRGDQPLFTAEDISRRCALEKALGYGFLRGVDPRDCWLFISCRVNEDMVRQAAEAGLSLLVSKSSPTAEAVELAEALGLTLICRAWPDRFERFCGSPPGGSGADN